jgi:osmotically-inducible protein OsmY
VSRPDPGAPDDAPDDAYVVEHVRDALATDPRTLVQGLRVTHQGDAIVLAGTVGSAARRDAVGVVAAEVANGLRICNETVVIEAGDHHRVEEVS